MNGSPERMDLDAATARLAADRGALRLAMRRLLRAQADNRPRTFVPAVEQAKPRMLGRAIVSSTIAVVSTRVCEMLWAGQVR